MALKPKIPPHLVPCRKHAEVFRGSMEYAEMVEGNPAYIMVERVRFDQLGRRNDWEREDTTARVSFARGDEGGCEMIPRYCSSNRPI